MYEMKMASLAILIPIMAILVGTAVGEAVSGRAVDAAGDVDVLPLDQTGTIMGSEPTNGLRAADE
jgi:high-affinity K+ transport system ATPase subunit B